MERETNEYFSSSSPSVLFLALHARTSVFPSSVYSLYYYTMIRTSEGIFRVCNYTVPRAENMCNVRTYYIGTHIDNFNKISHWVRRPSLIYIILLYTPCYLRLYTNRFVSYILLVTYASPLCAIKLIKNLNLRKFPFPLHSNNTRILSDII